MHHHQLLRLVPDTVFRATRPGTRPQRPASRPHHPSQAGYSSRSLWHRVPNTLIALASVVTFGFSAQSGEQPARARVDSVERVDVNEDGRVGDTTAAASVSLEPTISIEGGTPTTRTRALQAIGRYVSNGFELPDLVLRFHDDMNGCEGHRGLFRLTDGKPVIDLCFDEEFLALHELGHAWEYFNLDDADRLVFQQSIGAPTWNSPDVPHKFRAVEIAAETMAYGLLSAPAKPGSNWNRRSARFEALTGGPPPRQTSEVIARQ